MRLFWLRVVGMCVHPRCDLAERVRPEAIGPTPCDLRKGDDAGPPQDPQVLGHGRLAAVEGRGQLARAPRSALQELDDAAARRIGDRTERILA